MADSRSGDKVAAAKQKAAERHGDILALTALDRVLLGVHYPSDTVGGVLLACALVYSSWAGFRFSPATTEARR